MFPPNGARDPEHTGTQIRPNGLSPGNSPGHYPPKWRSRHRNSRHVRKRVPDVPVIGAELRPPVLQKTTRSIPHPDKYGNHNIGSGVLELTRLAACARRKPRRQQLTSICNVLILSKQQVSQPCLHYIPRLSRVGHHAAPKVS